MSGVTLSNAKKVIPLSLTTFESNALTVPLAKLRGLAYLLSGGKVALTLSKSANVIKASPLTVNSLVIGITFGKPFINGALCVMSSPTSPLPLVTADTKVPLLYVATIVKPSSFQDIQPS